VKAKLLQRDEPAEFKSQWDVLQTGYLTPCPGHTRQGSQINVTLFMY